MKLHGLELSGWVNKPALRAIDLVTGYSTFGLGDGLWSIEAKTTEDQSIWGPCLKEWVGSNGTRNDEEPDDLWAKVRAWEEDPEGGLQVIKPAYSYKEYQAPDGTKGSHSFFMREAKNGRLHGCLLSL